MPQIAAGGGWGTSIHVLNPADTPATGLVRFYDQGGQLLSLMVADDQTEFLADRVPLEIAANGSKEINILDASFVTQQGYAVLTRGEGALTSSVTFRQRVSGRPDFESGLPSWGVTTQKWLLPFDNMSGYSTSFAVVNPDTTPADYLFSFYDSAGAKITTEAIAVGGGQHQSFSSPQRWPAVANRRGSVRISVVSSGTSPSQFGVNPVALLFNSSGAFSWIYMVPVQ